MWRTILWGVDKYGLGVANLFLVGFCFWKIATNHLAHIQKDVKSNGEKLDKVEENVVKLGQRVAKIEGKIEK